MKISSLFFLAITQTKDRQGIFIFQRRSKKKGSLGAISFDDSQFIVLLGNLF